MAPADHRRRGDRSRGGHRPRGARWPGDRRSRADRWPDARRRWAAPAGARAAGGPTAAGRTTAEAAARRAPAGGTRAAARTTAAGRAPAEATAAAARAARRTIAAGPTAEAAAACAARRTLAARPTAEAAAACAARGTLAARPTAARPTAEASAARAARRTLVATNAGPSAGGPTAEASAACAARRTLVATNAGPSAGGPTASGPTAEAAARAARRTLVATAGGPTAEAAAACAAHRTLVATASGPTAEAAARAAHRTLVATARRPLVTRGRSGATAAGARRELPLEHLLVFVVVAAHRPGHPARGLALGLGLGPQLARLIGVLAGRAPRPARAGAAIEADHLAQLVELTLGQLARVADAQAVERQVGERHPLQLGDRAAERLEHAVDLARLALVERERQPRVLAVAGQLLDLGRRGDRAVVEGDAGAQVLEVGGLDVAVDLDVIGLRHVGARGQELGRQLAVVGQEQHALAVEVEAADRRHRHRQVRQVVHHRLATAIVGHRGDAGLGLVEDDVEQLLRRHRLAVDLDVGVERVDLGAELGHHLAVDGDPAGGDQLLGLAARGDSGLGDEALQAHERGSGHGSVPFVGVVVDDRIVGIRTA